VLRFSSLSGTTPGPWTTLGVGNVKKAVTVGSLTPGVTYAFEVQALGSEGYSDWSDSSTCMCV
jgi:Fibronectin type III domain